MHTPGVFDPQDKSWFDKCILDVVTEELGDDIGSLIPEEPYFVDFLR